MTKATQITFITVRDNTEKLKTLCDIVPKHFFRKEKLLISVASVEAAAYLDQLLWRQPEDSFIPHTVSQSSIKDFVAITPTLTNINQAAILIHLRPEMPSQISAYQHIYELLDLTHPSKEEISRQHLNAYRQEGWLVNELSL